MMRALSTAARRLPAATPRARPAAASAARPTRKQITAMLGAGGRDGALSAWSQFGRHFDDINLAVALRCVARRAAARPGALRTDLSRDALRSDLHGLLARVEERVPHFAPRELATVMHASSALPDERARALVGAAAVRARELAPQLTPQGMCLVVGACAKLGLVDAPLLRAIATAALAGAPGSGVPPIERFSPRDLSQLAWAYARLGHDEPKLFARIAEIAPRKLDAEPSSPQALANTAWAFARARADAPALLDALGSHALRRVGEFKPFELSMLLWALAKARAPHPPLFAAAAAQLGPRLGSLPPRSLSNLAWAYARADVRAEPLFRAIAAHVPARLDTFTPQALVNLGWAFCVCGLFPAELMRQLAARVCAAPVGPETPVAYLQQTAQLHNALVLDAPSLGLQLAPELVAACSAAIRAQHAARSSSNLHLSVSDALRRLGEPHDNEFCVPELGYFVDIALRRHQLLLEVNDAMFHGRAADGADGRGPPLGRQLMKYRHLRAAGWRVLLVSGADWERLGGCLSAQCAFLKGEIEAATASRADYLAKQRSRPPVIWSDLAPADSGEDERGARLEGGGRG